MEAPLNNLIENITSLFMEQKDVYREYINTASLFKINNENLKYQGDISFPIGISSWQNYFKSRHVNEELCKKLQDAETAEAAKESLLARASQWLPYRVQQLRIQYDRCIVFLNRCVCIEALLKQVLMDSNESGRKPYGMLRKRVDRKVQLKEEPTFDDFNDLSVYRASLVKSVLRRVLAYSEWTEIVDEAGQRDADGVLCLRVVSVVEDLSKRNKEDAAVLVKCGLVREPATGKMSHMATEEYLNLRTKDIRLMAMHKYGLRAENDERFCALMKRLGAAAVTVDLLEVKHSSPVRLIRNGQGSTKGASFILYNSARLETLLSKFEDLVASSTYAELPPLDAVDLKLLCEEEEWQLCFGYILQFPHLIERVLQQIEKGVCATHLIVRYLSGFVAVFSIYYRRIRILTQETRSHLMPYVYARIYLIKAVRTVLNRTLGLLDIEPVSVM